MAKLPPVRRLLREDLKDAPEWIDRLIQPINLFFESVYSALNRNLTLGDNVTAQIKNFTITAGAAATDNTFSFLFSIATKPRGVLVISCVQDEPVYTPLTGAVTVPSWRVNGDQVVIESITGLTNTKKYSISVLVI